MKTRHLPYVFVFLCLGFFSGYATAQTDSIKKIPTYKVAVFAPLYLDSIFNNNGFKYKQGIPKFMVPALEFVQGAQVALDSMQLVNKNVEAFIYDSKSYTRSIPQLIKSGKMEGIQLIIGAVKDMDYKQLSDYALQKNIPFISATFPNDGGVTANPFTVIVNATLKAHCEAIYSYLLQTHGTDRLILFRKKGVQEDKVAAYFKAINEPDGKPLLNIQVINSDSTVTSEFLRKKLDSNRHSVIVGGSLDENFAARLTLACYELSERYPLTLIGMPNWDGMQSLVKKDLFEDFPIYYTTPYYNSKSDKFSKMVTHAYMRRYNGKPSDMAYKGFETVYQFTQLLAKYPDDFMSHINDKSFKVFTDYNFKPVNLKKGTAIPDYFENKHLYFMKIMNGTESRAW